MSSQAAGLMAHPADRRSRSKRLRAILALGLVLIAALALPSASFAATDGDFTYESDGTSVTITARSAASFSSYLTIPDSIGGEPVTAIRNNAFAFDSNLHSISIPASVTRIESSAFYGSGLMSVTFAPGSQLESIGYAAFTSTPGLTSITIPASVTSIDQSAFYSSGLTSVTFLGDVPSLGANAFAGVPNGAKAYVSPNYTGYGAVGDDFNGLTVASLLTSTSSGGEVTITGCALDPCPLTAITIPASIGGEPVTAIGDHAFEDTHALTSITIPASVTSLGSWAFYGSGLTSVTFEAGSQLATIADHAFTYTSSLSSITIPASVTSVGALAFYASGLTSGVVFLGDVPSVGANAFFTGASGISAYVSPNYTGYGAVGDDFNGLTVASLLTYTSSGGEATITGCAFDPCPLTAITIPDVIGGDPVTAIGDNAFQDNPAQDTSALTSITIPSSVTSIGERAFDGSGLASVTFAAGSQLATIGAYAFQGTSGLASVTIPASVTSIGVCAFTYSGLTTVSFGPGSQLATIGAGAFQFISGLTSITIPDSVTSIGDYAFSGASSLERVIFKGNAPTLAGAGVFDGVAAGAKAVLVGGVTGYGADATWNGLVVQRAFQVDTGSSPVNRGAVIKATDLDLLNRPVFAWQRCSTLDDASSCSAILGSLGANGAWWGTRNADIGQQVRLKAISDGSDWLTGLSGVVGPANTTYPSLNQGLVGGAPKQGTALHTSFGTWDGYIAGTSTVAFQWQRCSTSAVNSCTTNIGTNSQWYRPVAADVGKYLRVTATLTTNGQTAGAGTLVSGQVASNLAGRRAHTAVRHKPSRHKHKTHKRSQHKRR